MTSVNQLIVIIPVILNLKGNIEMNLSARLGTASNIGDLDTPSIRNALILGNLALLQVQAVVVSFIAACFSFFLSTIIPGVGEAHPEPLPADARDPFRHYLRSAGQGHSLRRPRPTPPPGGVSKPGFYECVHVRDRRLPSLTVSSHRFMVLTSTSMSAACLSSVLLGSFMCFLVVLCRKLGRDPGAVQVPTTFPHWLMPRPQITSRRRLLPVLETSSQ
jgi:solute carrier family 41